MEEQPLIMDDNLLWEYADGLLPEPRRAQVEAYLSDHPEEWMPRLQAIGAEKRVFQSMPLEAPPKGFAASVMAAWAGEQLQERDAPDWVIRGIGAVFALFILLPIAILVASGGSSAELGVTMPEIPEVDWVGALSHPVVQYSLYFVFTGLALSLLNAVLSQYRNMNKMMI